MKCEDISGDIDRILQEPDNKEVLNRLEKHFKECETCRSEYGEVINTAAKLSEVGTISDIIDVSDDFVEKTRDEAQKESDRHRVSSVMPTNKKRLQNITDYIIIGLLIGTVVAAVILFYLAIIYL